MPRDKDRIARNLIEIYVGEEITFQESLRRDNQRRMRRGRGGFSFGGGGAALSGDWSGEHHELNGNLDDDHTQYVHNTSDRDVTATHTFKATIPFAIENDTMITNLNADKVDGDTASNLFK